ncbi:unnamed protein product, partial [Mycena citricolor]
PMAIPPGLASNSAEYSSGNIGDHDWLPAYPNAELDAGTQSNLFKHCTNAFVFREENVLLGYKKRGLGVNKYNGFGGKVEPGETVAGAAVRELQEEAGIAAPLVRVGTLIFVVPDQKWMQIDVFRADEYSGDITESEEMRPQWFSQSNLPFDDMWAADRYWFPLLVSGQHFIGRLDFDNGGEDNGYILRRWWIGKVE